MKKCNKQYERITQCVQIHTDNTDMNKNNLDYSGGATIPQYVFNGSLDSVDFFSKRPLKVFADLDLMYNESVSVTDSDEILSKNNSDNMIPLLNED